VPTPESEAYSSTADGLSDLQHAVAEQATDLPGQPYLVEGYSQSASIAVLEKEDLASLDADQRPDVTFLLLGNPTSPTVVSSSDSSGWTSRESGPFSTAPCRPTSGSRRSTSPTSTTASVIFHSSLLIRSPT
jgi:hypothetical protein